MEVEGYTQFPSHKVAFKWKLNGLIGLMEAARFDKIDKTFKSLQFSAKSKLNDKWHLELTLHNLDQTADKGWAEIKLCLDNRTSEVRAEATFFMLNSKKERVFVVSPFCRNFSNGRNWFIDRFFEINKLLENKDYPEVNRQLDHK